MFNENSPTALTVWLADTPLGQVGLAPICVCEYLPDPAWVCIPTAHPRYSRAVEWQSQLIPVLRSVDPQAQTRAEQQHFPVLLLYTLDRETPVIGVTLIGSPKKVVVDDSMSERFSPQACGFWADKLLSGFVLEGNCVPLIDPDRLVQAGDFPAMMH